MTTIKGFPVHPGIVEGSVFIKLNSVKAIPNKNLPPLDVETEIACYLGVLDSLKKEFQDLLQPSEEKSKSTTTQLIELYIALLGDPTFTQNIPNLIKEKKRTAVKAVQETMKIIEQEFSKIENEYFRSRFDDFKSIGDKILEKILGHGGFEALRKPKIIVAESLSVAELLHIPPTNILGIITATGGATSHTAILAESLNIPAIFGIKEQFNLFSSKDRVIMDAYTGTIVLGPSPSVSSQYQEIKKRRIQYEHDMLQTTKNCSAENSEDNECVFVMANIGNLNDTSLVEKYHADGIGLYRTEDLFLASSSYLDEEDQARYYEKLMEQTKGPVTIRTLDIGGDKTIKNSVLSPVNEDNPFLGFRSTRLFVQDPTEFKKQIRALITTYEKHPRLKIMIPFISTLEDFISLKKVCLDIYEEIHGHRECPIPIGMMAEVPSTAIAIRDFLPYTDFVSIGSNDLIQYLLAVDRNNTSVAHYHSSSNPALLMVLRHVAQACKEHKIPISICGEIGKEPHLARLLLGFGITTFSMSPINIPIIKYIVMNSSKEECEKLAEDLKPLIFESEITAYLQKDLDNFLKSRGVSFDAIVDYSDDEEQS